MLDSGRRSGIRHRVGFWQHTTDNRRFNTSSIVFGPYRGYDRSQLVSKSGLEDLFGEHEEALALF
jgi:hypothetical protein